MRPSPRPSPRGCVPPTSNPKAPRSSAPPKWAPQSLARWKSSRPDASCDGSERRRRIEARYVVWPRQRKAVAPGLVEAVEPEADAARIAVRRKRVVAKAAVADRHFGPGIEIGA